MKTIYKYHIHKKEEVIRVSAGSEPLSFGVQGDDFVLWVLHPDTESFSEHFKVRLLFTGEPIDPGEKLGKFIGTATNDGIVAHCFVS